VSYDDVAAVYRDFTSDRYISDQMDGRRKKLFDHIIDLIEENIGVDRLLDVGTSCGSFLLAARDRNWRVEGIEPSTQAVTVARHNNNLDVFHGTLQEYDEDAQFGAITFINVLEHSAQPWLEIHRATELIRPGGLLYIRFPNGFLHSKTLQLAHQVGLSDHVLKFLVFHRYVFTARHIRRLLEDHGFIHTALRNSPPSEGDPHRLFLNQMLAAYSKKLAFSLARLTENISRGQLFLGVSLEVTALKP
jgi:2-polyprenyl-3-methyl-5-hydroxy-6-metoxy-1,4-benzoquinol methylase